MNIQLIMPTGQGRERTFTLDKEVSIVGRDHKCHLRIPLGNVSREHCRIERDQGLVYLRDLGSTNGTYVNNTRVDEIVTLGAGDVIQIASVKFTVHFPGPLHEATPDTQYPLDSLMRRYAVDRGAGATEKMRGSATIASA